jgi:DNA mismatch endonuclease, patch repair protein
LMSKIQGGIAKNSLERSVHNWLKGTRVKHTMNPKIEGWPDVRIETKPEPIYLFLDGCFWHVCPQHYQRPKSRQDFWVPHVEESNIRRERLRRQLPYKWIRIWEHEVDDESYKDKLTRELGIPRSGPAKAPGASR